MNFAFLVLILCRGICVHLHSSLMRFRAVKFLWESSMIESADTDNAAFEHYWTRWG